MNDAQYRELVAELVANHPPETAARMIERRCHPPYPAEVAEGEAGGGAA